MEKACAVDGNEILKQAAESAALQWKFKSHFGTASVLEAGARKYMLDVIAFHFALDNETKVTSQGVVIVKP